MVKKIKFQEKFGWCSYNLILSIKTEEYQKYTKRNTIRSK
jgi:hypothetical protein